MHKGSNIDLDAVLAGDAGAIAHFVRSMTPVIQTRVARCLLNMSPRDMRQDVQDHCQDVFAHLFAERAQVLRRFEAARGLSLQNYVGMIAQRRVVSALRSGKNNAWRESAVFDERVVTAPSLGDPEGHATDQSEVAALFESLRRTLSPLAWRVFQLLYVHDLSVDEVTARTGLSADAVYAWRSRLRKAARAAQDALTAATEAT